MTDTPDTYNVDLFSWELQAIIEWNADPSRTRDMPAYFRYSDHIKRANELLLVKERLSGD